MTKDLSRTDKTLGDTLRGQGISRRSFLKFCAATASMMALPPSMIPTIANALEKARRPSVIWLSFQECISLDYHHTLQAAAGHAAEAAREAAMEENKGKYLVVVDGSIPTGNPGYSTIAGISNRDMLLDTAKHAAAIVSVGTCAAFGGIPHAKPNPTGAVAVSDIIKDKHIINVSGCPPIPVVITGVLTHYLTFGTIPELDDLGRPKAFFGQSIHDRCYRRPFYDKGLFAESFDDEGARQGWCLYKLGCKGPTSYNACATTKWNNGVSFPIESGHPCLGCSEPNFWDGGGFYKAISIPTEDITRTAMYSAAVGIAAGVAIGTAGRVKKANVSKSREKVTIDDLEK